MVDVSTSILSVKKENIIDTIYKLEEAKTNYFHIDVMDGEFVKNNTHDIMLEYAEYLDHVTKVPLDVHLMVKDIKNYVDSYLIFNPNIITFHYEACKDKEEVFEIYKRYGKKSRNLYLTKYKFRRNKRISTICTLSFNNDSRTRRRWTKINSGNNSKNRRGKDI